MDVTPSVANGLSRIESGLILADVGAQFIKNRLPEAPSIGP
jgi:hypothetical protein